MENLYPAAFNTEILKRFLTQEELEDLTNRYQASKAIQTSRRLKVINPTVQELTAYNDFLEGNKPITVISNETGWKGATFYTRISHIAKYLNSQK